MTQKFTVTYGRTESGDQIGAAVWDGVPTEEQVLAYYRQNWAKEFEAFGDDGGLTIHWDRDEVPMKVWA